MKLFDFIKRKSSVLKNNTRTRITLLLLIPVLTLSIGLYYFVWSDAQSIKASLKSNYLYALKGAAQESENDISNIIDFIASYSNNKDFVYLMQQDSPDTSACLAEINELNSALTSRYDIVDSVFIYNKKQGFCVTPFSVSDSDSFFNSVYCYRDYDQKYWKQYNYYYSSLYQHRSLPPTLTTVNGQTKYIQPLVFLQLDNTLIKNFIVVNISFESVLEKAALNYDLDENTYILNNHMADAFSATASESMNIYNTSLYNNLVQNKTSFDYTWNGKKYYIIAHQKSGSLSSYTYFSMIPYSKLHKKQFEGISKAFIILLTIMLITFFIALQIGRLITSPIENIAAKLQKDSNVSNTDLIATINSSIDNISNKTNSFDMLLPYMQEKYLIDFLNSTEYVLDDVLRDFLKSTLPFKFPYFSSIIVQLYPLPKFYEEYTMAEIANIQTGFYNIVKDAFSSELHSCIPTTEKDILYIIVNAENNVETESKIGNILSNLNNLLKSDWTQIVLMSGIGGVYEGYDGLKKSHKEALDSLNAMPKEQPKVIISSSHKASKAGTLSYKDEENLTNYLITFNYSAALDLFNEIMKKNEHTDSYDLKNIYSQIIHIMVKIMRSKNMLDTEGRELDYKSILEILDKPTSDIKNEILILLSRFKSDYNMQNPTAANITAYLQSEYRDPNLSLESIADAFAISKTYISSILKKHLGITFREYLTSLRIGIAKKLLSTTDMPISEILTETGFSNKQTFSRVFKSATGMTALEYRKKHRGK